MTEVAMYDSPEAGLFAKASSLSWKKWHHILHGGGGGGGSLME